MNWETLIANAIGSAVGAGVVAWSTLRNIERRVTTLEATMDRRARAYLAKAMKEEE